MSYWITKQPLICNFWGAFCQFISRVSRQGKTWLAFCVISIICIWQSCCRFFSSFNVSKHTIYMQEKVLKCTSKSFSLCPGASICFISFMCHLKRSGIHLKRKPCYGLQCSVQVHSVQCSPLYQTNTKNRHHQSSGWKFPQQNIFFFTHKDSEASSITESICQAGTSDFGFI